MHQVNFAKVTDAARMHGDDEEDTALLHQMLCEAELFIAQFKWCKSLLHEYFGLGVGGVVAVFLFRIDAEVDAEDLVWVVVGDLPPLYVSVKEAPNPACALDVYVNAMAEWADAAIRGASVGDLVPVAAPPTPENGYNLRKRLDFIRREILAWHTEDLRG